MNEVNRRKMFLKKCSTCKKEVPFRQLFKYNRQDVCQECFSEKTKGNTKREK